MKKLNISINMLIFIIIVALAVLFSTIGITMSIANRNKEPVEAVIENPTVETLENEAIQPTNGFNVAEDGTVIGDKLDAVKFISTDTVAFERPDVSSNIAAELSCGDSVLVTIHSSKGWCEIKYQGVTMYVDAQYLVAEKIETEDEAAVKYDENAEPQYSEDGVYLIVNEEVLTEGDVWLHKEPRTNSEKVIVLNKGYTIVRVGVGSNGWSQIDYDGEILYVATYWVTPIKAPKYDEVQEFVKLTESANLREESSINSRKIAALDKGVELVRIGIGRNGWSKVIYNGRVRYIYSTYITPIDRAVTESDLVLKD